MRSNIQHGDYTYRYCPVHLEYDKTVDHKCSYHTQTQVMR